MLPFRSFFFIMVLLMVCLLFAMDKECASLLQTVHVRAEKRFGFCKTYEAEREGVSFLIAVSGIGKGFASAAVAAVCAHYEIDAFLNVGVAGSQRKEVADILSCVIGETYVEHDMDTSALGDPVGMISGINLVELPSSPLCREALEQACDALTVPYAFGVISSGDTFLKEGEAKREVTARFRSLSLDMESAPYAQIAFVYGVPFASARVISDAEHPETEYLQNVEAASARASQIAWEAVKALSSKR